MKEMHRLICFVLITAGLTQGQQRQDPPWLKLFVHKRIVYEVHGMKSVRPFGVLKSVEKDDCSTDGLAGERLFFVVAWASRSSAAFGGRV